MKTIEKIVTAHQIPGDANMAQRTLKATQTFFDHLLESQLHKTSKDNWPELMQKCILRRGRYFEKDRSKNEDVGSDSE